MTPQDRTAIRSGLVAALLWGGAAGVGVHPLAGVLAALVAGFTATGFRLPASLVRDAAASVWSGTKKATGLRSASIPVKYVVPLLLLTSLSGRGCDGITLPDVKWPDINWREIVPDVVTPVESGPLTAVVVLETQNPVLLTQRDALASPEVAAYIGAHFAKRDGHPEWRRFDDDETDLSEESPEVQAAFTAAKAETERPSIAIRVRGETVFNGPLPADEAGLLALLKRYGGE